MATLSSISEAMIVEAQITINATKAAVWAATTDVAFFAQLLSGVEQIEIVERPVTGLVGLKWKETRKLFGESATVEKWITQAKENEYYTTRAEQDGFVFITTNRISGSDGSVVLTGIHETRPQGFAAKLKALPMVFFKGVIKKAILKDLKDIKTETECKTDKLSGPPRNNLESWRYINRFIDRFLDNEHWSKWKTMARSVVRALEARELAPAFRIGQSMYHIILSTSEHHVLTSEPRVTLEFQPSAQIVRVVYGYGNLHFGEPVTEEWVALPDAVPQIVHCLQRLWNETKPGTPMPEGLKTL